jgi:nucleotidyltransferase/DNA polymerase involved in DNA repair
LPLPLSALPADPEMQWRLHRLGVRTLGALAALPRPALVRQFGPQAGPLHDLARGVDPRPVQSDGPPRARARAFDDPLGQHEGWTGEFGVWKEQAFALDHRVISIAHLGGARQAMDGFALNPQHVYNM